LCRTDDIKHQALTAGGRVSSFAAVATNWLVHSLAAATLTLRLPLHPRFWAVKKLSENLPDSKLHPKMQNLRLNNPYLRKKIMGKIKIVSTHYLCQTLAISV